MDFNNYENQTFDTIPSNIEGSNFTNCRFKNAHNSRFKRCNIDECVFDTPTTFELCNVYYTNDKPLPEGCTVIKSNLVNKDEPLVEER